jgi:hypothetical protein
LLLPLPLDRLLEFGKKGGALPIRKEARVGQAERHRAKDICARHRGQA